MKLVLFFILFCIVVAIIAESKGRSGFAWFVISALINPI